MGPELVLLKGDEFVDRSGFRREDDLFLDYLHDEMRSKDTVLESLDEALHALKRRSYVFPRVYRKKGDECLLLRWLDLPEEFVKGRTSFSVRHPVLEKIIEGNDIYQNTDVCSEHSLVWGLEDQMDQIREEGMVGIPYVGVSEIYSREIKGAIIVNYDPKVKRVDLAEIAVLHRVGQLVGDKVTGLLEVGLFREKQKELENLNRQLALQVNLDGPTGLYNKKTFHKHLEMYLGEGKRGDKSYYLIMFDCDGLKSLNDKKGHPAGDEFISALGKCLRDVDRIYGTVSYRLGGDEFAVVETGSVNDAVDLAEGIRKAVGGIPVPNGCKQITASIGVVEGSIDFDSGEEWYNIADEAIYKAKGSSSKFWRCLKRGGDRIFFYEEEKMVRL